MPGIVFSFKEIIDELDAISSIAASFLTRHSLEVVLPRFKAQLEQIRARPCNSTYPWQIHEEMPLRSQNSCGEYERDGKGALTVFGDITSVWELEPLGPHNSKSLQGREFAVAGLASTRMRVFEWKQDAQAEEIAMWRAEIGQGAAPGCHFHVQVLGQNETPPFPKALSIPRLPGHMATPMSAIEFLLGELFQEKWEREVAKDTPAIQRWRSIQAKRFRCHLDWQKKTLEEKSGSPWVALKTRRPDANLFSGPA